MEYAQMETISRCFTEAFCFDEVHFESEIFRGCKETQPSTTWVQHKLRKMQNSAKDWGLGTSARRMSLRGKRETAQLDLCSQKKIYNFNSLMWARFYWMPFFFLIESWHTTKNKESTQWSSSNSFSVLTHARWQRKVIQPSRENHKS